MKKLILPVLLLAAVLLISGCTQKAPTKADDHVDELGTPVETEQPTTPAENIIEITSSGFNPNSLTIKTGEKVTFVNKDSRQHWPATNVHPTHTLYPGSSISKCPSDTIFDACKGLSKDESWSFTFNNAGSWDYHDHLNPGLGGTIIVK